MGIENRSSKMKFKIGILKVEIENWNWNLKLNVDIEDSKMKFKKEIEYWNCEEFKKVFDGIGFLFEIRALLKSLFLVIIWPPFW